MIDWLAYSVILEPTIKFSVIYQMGASGFHSATRHFRNYLFLLQLRFGKLNFV